MSQCSSGRNKNPPALAVGSVKKYSKDDGKMDVFIRSNENMSHMDRMAAEVMKCIGKIPMEIEEGGEVNMCKAIDDMMEKREQKGKLEGKQEILMELVKDGLLSAKAAADKVSMSVDDFESVMRNNNVF